MKAVQVFSFDGSFQSFLGTLYEILQSDPPEFRLLRKKDFRQTGLFGMETTGEPPAFSVKMWEALKAKAGYLPRMIYFAFLSEAPGIENLLAEYLCVVFERRCAQDADRAALQRKLYGWARAVEKEKTQLENSLLFVSAGRKTPECHITPKYNVLPLLSRHFRTRYGSSPWMIVDRKRNYGLYGENGKVSLVQKGWERMRNVPVNPRASGQTERQRIRPAI